MIKLVRSTARSSHVCLHPARPPAHLPVPYARLAVAALVAVRRPPPPLARAVHVSCRPPVARSPVPGRFSDCHRDAATIDWPLFPRSRVDVSGGHLSTCCLIKMAAASSLDRICMKSAHRFIQQGSRSKIISFGFNLAYG